MLEPRRLAARMAARRVAEEMGERPGETVGWQVRFEEVAGPRTRLRYVTEGLLTRRLVADPALPGVSAVVLDEFHERHLQGDLALALLRRLQETSRPDLRLVVMSATLDAAPVARLPGRAVGPVGGAPLRGRGRAPLARRRRPRRSAGGPGGLGGPPGGRPSRPGDVLVFLPGMAEIRRAAQACAPLASRLGLDLLPLHGDLSPGGAGPGGAPGPAPQGGPLHQRGRELGHHRRRHRGDRRGAGPGGLPLPLVRAPPAGGPPGLAGLGHPARRARRADRAGPLPAPLHPPRLRHPPRVRRPGDPARGPLRDAPRRGLAWTGRSFAGSTPRRSPPPRPPATCSADLGALDAGGAVTPMGRRLLRFPLHPRLARLVVEADDRGAGPAGALLAALLAERDVRERSPDRGRGAPPTGPSDLLELAHLVEQAARARFDPDRLRSLGLSPGAAQAVERSRRQIAQLLGRGAGRAGRPCRGLRRRRCSSPHAGRLPGPRGAAARPGQPRGGARRRGIGPARRGERGARGPAPRGDRRRRAARPARPGSRRPASGRGGPGARPRRLGGHAGDDPGALPRRPALGGGALLERRGRSGSTRSSGCATATSSSRRPASPHPDPERAAALLAEEALARGSARLRATEGELDALLARVAFAARAAPESGLAPLSEEDVAAALREACTGRRSFAELREAGLADASSAACRPGARALLERLAPERITLGRGPGRPGELRGGRRAALGGEPPPGLLRRRRGARPSARDACRSCSTCSPPTCARCR